MTNEIKEIIEYLKDDSMFISDEDGTRKEITLDESKLLLDYITNLQEEKQEMKNGWQEENEKNKEYIEFYKDMTDNWKDMSNVFKKSCEDYKQRIDKAIEYIEENTTKEYEVPLIDSFSISYQKLVDILRGDE